MLMISFKNRCGRLVTEEMERGGMCYRVVPCAASVRGVGSVGPGKVVFANKPGDTCLRSSPGVTGRVFRVKIPVLNVYCKVRMVSRVLNNGMEGKAGTRGRCKGARVACGRSTVFRKVSAGVM